MKDLLGTYIDKLTDWYIGLSGREKNLVAGLALTAVVLGLYTAGETIYQTFEEQSVQLAKVEEDMKKLTPLLSGYKRLRTQKDGIDKRFSDVRPGFAVRSYLEDLIKGKAKVSSRININPTATEDFGDTLSRTKVKVRFSADGPAQLADFLKAIQTGKYPLLLSEISINRLGRRLDVSAEVHSITPKANET